ncbi:hypothetical protein SCHPADRAFT_370881 [Schizopora paradoxa]|uniref:Uncharacterized protein n=1 Tax=Schizopora paradoxa TaxID=27342 RepID=A0A0H2S932_9AGAM|nr:hypothetical protein SCHPADRAFT_370881 [Schizopora paradoxa]
MIIQSQIIRQICLLVHEFPLTTSSCPRSGHGNQISAGKRQGGSGKPGRDAPKYRKHPWPEAFSKFSCSSTSPSCLPFPNAISSRLSHLLSLDSRITKYPIHLLRR